jgi:hypothetical protein
MKAIAILTCVAAFTFANVAVGAEPERQAKVLVVLRTRDTTKHVRLPDSTLRSRIVFADQPWLDANYRSAIRDFDRDAPLAAALTLAFRERARFVELTSSADRDRYMAGSPLGKPTSAARAEGFDFVLALYDSFVGFAPRDYHDDEAGLLRPAYEFSYALHDLSTNQVIRRGGVGNFGFKQASFDGSIQDRDLFQQTWPYLCLENATDMVDELLRNDAVHEMAAHVGRAAEYPAVRKDIETYRKRLVWQLKPAPGWTVRRTHDLFARFMAPRGEFRHAVWMYVDVELLLPALGQQAKTAEEFIGVYDRDRARLMPDSPVTTFTDIQVPGYSAWRYALPGGEQELVFMRKTSAVTMQVVTVSFVGKFDELYPPLREDIREMLAHSTVTLD